METKIKETQVEVWLNFASRVRFNEKGYNFPLEWVRERRKVLVKVLDLQPKSNAKITRICRGCQKEEYMTFHKGRLNPLCHHCITQTVEFSKKTSMGTQKALVAGGARVRARRLYLNSVGDLPDGYCIHHINMDASDNRLENFIPLSRSQHHITHGTFNRLCKKLMSLGVVKFNEKTFSYELAEEFQK